jgi:hypothetical protein
VRIGSTLTADRDRVLAMVVRAIDCAGHEADRDPSDLTCCDATHSLGPRGEVSGPRIEENFL